MLILPIFSRIYQGELLALAKEAKDDVKKIILYWTQNQYDQLDDTYHLCIGKDGEIYQTCSSLLDKKQYLSRDEQKGTIAIALCAGFEAKNERKERFSPGSNPPTLKQINCLVWLLAYLCYHMALSIRFDTVLTHGELTIQNREVIGTKFFWLRDLENPKCFRFGGAMLRELAQEKRMTFVVENLPPHLRTEKGE